MIHLCLKFSIMKRKTSPDLITILLYIYNFSLVIRRAQVSLLINRDASTLRRIIGGWASYIRDHTMRVLLFVFSSPLVLKGNVLLFCPKQYQKQ